MMPPDELEITEENCKQLLYEYARENYAWEFPNAAGECPYHTDDLEDELAFKEVLEWFILERVQPRTGKTILREFVEKFVKDPELRSKMLQMEQVFRGTFRVAEVRGCDAVLVCLSTGKEYKVRLLEENKPHYKVGRIVTTRMHPWEGIYKPCGIGRLRPSEDELMAGLGMVSPEQVMEWFEKGEIKRRESIMVYNNSSTSSILNKYPFQWVDGISNALGIDTRYRKAEKVKMIVELLHSPQLPKILERLPGKSREALAFVLKKGGVVRYPQLSRKFDDEIGLWWNEHPPKSTVGVLRLHGLLFVGKMPIGGRIFKVALVPAELREKLMEALSRWGMI